MSRIALDAATVYWLDATANTVVMVPKARGSPTVIADGLWESAARPVPAVLRSTRSG